METSLQEIDQARCILELGIAQISLDKPENLWKAYVDFESNNDRERAIDLFEKLLERTKNVNEWLSYAMFEAFTDDGENLLKNEMQCIQRAQNIFERAVDYFRISASELKEDRAMLLEEWLRTEKSSGEIGDIDLVAAKQPLKVKKRRLIKTEDGSGGYESQSSNMKILEAAYKWKKQKYCL
ncbi:Crooked neck-like protein 1 [Camellia lanceoleosa]|uniref:Crooked neck-like protein 1 n=1 Tax=Camellia lanceoleosa TaxID=1840588 RepID=A0ACC0GUL8_9ERIC|nr:Crooked neck-like protein 1 [Camellia lanceoleosa]